jgi:hypothetical protein
MNRGFQISQPPEAYLLPWLRYKSNEIAITRVVVEMNLF